MGIDATRASRPGLKPALPAGDSCAQATEKGRPNELRYHVADMRYANAHIVVGIERHAQIDQPSAGLLGRQVADHALEVAARERSPEAVTADNIGVALLDPIADHVNSHNGL